MINLLQITLPTKITKQKTNKKIPVWKDIREALHLCRKPPIARVGDINESNVYIYDYELMNQ